MYNNFFFSMNILLNEYFRYNFELIIELNNFWAKLNVSMNNHNVIRTGGV